MPQQKKVRKNPFVTLNAFGSYILAESGIERERILRDMKYYHEAKASQYHSAREAIIRYLVDSSRSVAIIEDAISHLASSPIPSDLNPDQLEYELRRRRICGDALKSFLASITRFEFPKYTLTRNHHTTSRVMAEGVIISCKYDIVMRRLYHRKKHVGALLFRFSKTSPFNQKAGSLCSIILRSRLKHIEQQADEILHKKSCILVDVFDNCQFYDPPQAEVRSREEVKALCRSIASIWPSL